MAVSYNDAMFPKEKILERLGRPEPDFGKPDERLEGLLALAELPVPVYLTTNYDDLMARRSSIKEGSAARALPLAQKSGDEPTAANPVVFHLHGHDRETRSLVLTEDDYLD